MRSQNAKNLNIYVVNLLLNIKSKIGGKLIAIAVADKVINIVMNELFSNSFIEIFILVNDIVLRKYDKFIFELIK
tara:strand:+ start:223 stop:447 length:225 start_codon:yes stop_codon:yes gene_type:complete